MIAPRALLFLDLLLPLAPLLVVPPFEVGYVPSELKPPSPHHGHESNALLPPRRVTVGPARRFGGPQVESRAQASVRISAGDRGHIRAAQPRRIQNVDPLARLRGALGVLAKDSLCD